MASLFPKAVIQKINVFSISSDTTFNINQSGSTILVDVSSGNIIVTLPTPSDNSGAFFRFFVTSTSGGNTLTVTSSSSVVSEYAALAGDYLEIFSDGLSWHVIYGNKGDTAHFP